MSRHCATCGNAKHGRGAWNTSRLAVALTRAKGDRQTAVHLLEQRAALANSLAVMKAAVTGAITSDPAYLALAELKPMSDGFVAELANVGVLDAL